MHPQNHPRPDQGQGIDYIRKRYGINPRVGQRVEISVDGQEQRSVGVVAGFAHGRVWVHFGAGTPRPDALPVECPYGLAWIQDGPDSEFRLIRPSPNFRLLEDQT